MFTVNAIEAVTEYVLFASCLFILAGSILISFKLRFIQLRFIPSLLKMLKLSLFDNQKTGDHTILPHKALLTAMSTTIGIGTIVGPIIAIHLGGPGALLGFLLTSFFGTAATFTEVNLCIKFRKKLESGEILGGPMQYLKAIFSPAAAKWYAICCFILMTAWSGAQANQLAAILSSPLLGDYQIPTFISGIAIASLVILTLVGGIKRVASMSSKLVPVMFVLYLGSCFWILSSNVDKLGTVFYQIFDSAFSPYAMASGTVVGGIVSALRWGIFKGTQACEAGVGTQTIPHSMAETENSISQGTIAMLSTYTAGLIGFLSGCVALVTNTWQNPELPLGISMMAASFEMYFSSFGTVIISFSTFLFVFGTILGNSYNGSQCFGYLTKNKMIPVYYALTAIIIFFSCIGEAKTVWSLIDIILAFMALPHMFALVYYVFKKQPQEEYANVILENPTEVAALES